MLDFQVLAIIFDRFRQRGSMKLSPPTTFGFDDLAAEDSQGGKKAPSGLSIFA